MELSVTRGCLNQHERTRAHALHAADCSPRSIAHLLDRAPSTLGRELQRNSAHGRYLPKCRVRRSAIAPHSMWLPREPQPCCESELNPPHSINYGSDRDNAQTGLMYFLAVWWSSPSHQEFMRQIMMCEEEPIVVEPT